MAHAETTSAAMVLTASSESIDSKEACPTSSRTTGTGGSAEGRVGGYATAARRSQIEVLI
jgi:hypothetical protein